MSYSFDEELEKANSEYGGTQISSFYKVQEGNSNVIRVLTRGSQYAKQFMGMKNYRTLYGKEKGDPLRQPDDADAKKPGRIVVPVNEKGQTSKPSIISVVYILDRTDNKIKIAELSYSIVKQIAELQKNPDYKFDDLPMPYDLRITYKKEAAPNEKYRVEVKPGSEDLTPEQVKELELKVSERSTESIAEKQKTRQIESDEKFGMRISQEELAKDASDYNANMVATMKKQREGMNKNTTSGIEYPDDEINPEDIPF